MKCQHGTQDLGYREWHADAERRHKRGEKQSYCGVCGKWVWNPLFTSRQHAMTARQFADAVKKAEQTKEMTK